MRIRSLSDPTRAPGAHEAGHPLNRRWGILPNRVHLRRGIRMKGHILRIHRHRGQDTS
jgi:hypothetical protein